MSKNPYGASEGLGCGVKIENRLQLSCWNEHQASQLREILKGIKFLDEDWRGGSYPKSPEILFFIDNLTLPQVSMVLAKASRLAIALQRPTPSGMPVLYVHCHFAAPINQGTVWEGYLKPEDFQD